MYRPLPQSVTIKSSPTEGLGLFSQEQIAEGAVLGVSHYENEVHGLIRTPLGGFINYSDTPNLERTESSGGVWYLRALREIEDGEELFLKYKDYNPTKKDVVLTHELIESKGFKGSWVTGYYLEGMGQITIEVYEDDDKLDIFIAKLSTNNFWDERVKRVSTESQLDKIIAEWSK